MRTPASSTRCACAALLAVVAGNVRADPTPVVERVTTIAPYPRGLAMVDGTLYVLCRGRVRGPDGGVSAAVDDQAGTIYAVDPSVTEPVTSAAVCDAVKSNGRVFARPTAPPFRPWDRASVPPEADTRTDRPYCTLRYHEPTASFYICAFSGIDKAQTPADPVAFSKNRSDAILRYDMSEEKWFGVERHRTAGAYPHHDPERNNPPHGWLEGPDNCLAVGRWLYAVSKDNSLLVRYDLSEVDRGAPPSAMVLGDRINVEGLGPQRYLGQSALAFHDGWLYVGYRTSSVIVRIRLDEQHEPIAREAGRLEAQLVARFDPFDPATRRSANITDMTFDDDGRLYVVSAKPARVYRFTPDPATVFDARAGRADPWLDLAAATPGETGAPRKAVKSENVLYHDGWLYVTSGDGYSYQGGANGTVYRVQVEQ